MAFCIHCGAKLPGNTKFCPYCGKPISAPAPAPEPQATAPAPQYQPTPAPAKKKLPFLVRLFLVLLIVFFGVLSMVLG